MTKSATVGVKIGGVQQQIVKLEHQNAVGNERGMMQYQFDFE